MHGVKRTRLTSELRELKREKDKVKIKNYNSLQDIVLTSKEQNVFDERALEQTTLLLDLNPEFYTIWNYRRDILVKLYSKLENRELEFTMKQLLKYPKCYWIWNHRVWCLNHLNDQEVYRKELLIVNQMLTRDERNYHGWAYRRIIIALIEGFVRDKEELLQISIDEFEYTTQMINRNISNYSAWHNRSRLIMKIFDQQQDTEKKYFKDVTSFLQAEIQYLINAFFMDCEDSSIWIYIRWLVTSDFFHSEPSDVWQDLKEKIIEVNELEKMDKDKDNEWCLKTINLIQSSSI